MSKKGRAGGIQAALARQATVQAATWQPLEVAMHAQPVPEEYQQETSAKFELYISKREAIAKQLARNRAAAEASQGDKAGATDQNTEVAKWQSNAAFCTEHFALWPGSGVVLQLQQQEALLHFVADADLHTDPMLAAEAYSLLLQNLAQHPPVKLVVSSTPDQTPVLQCAANNDLCWIMFNHSSKRLLPDAASPFPLLQQLLQNAVHLVTGRRPGSSGSAKSTAAASQGQALLLLYVVQLLQADFLVRQAAFERYMQLSQSLDNQAHKDKAISRAQTVLQHSLLYRVMQDDSVGGESWRYIPGSHKGKHQLVRDLLLLTAISGNEAASSAVHKTLDTAQAAAAGSEPNGDVEMADADAPAAAAAAETAAAAAGPGPAALVTAQALMQAARVLLLLLLQLYSSCEEAGVYGRGAEGRHHMQRVSGAGQPNDRFELDAVIMYAIHPCGRGAAMHTLPQLDQRSNLQRLLLALSVVHRVRLLSMMVEACIISRVVDPERDGKLEHMPHNMELQGWETYINDGGRETSSFMQPSPVLILQGVDARLEWSAKEMFGGGALFALLLGTLISSAAATMRTAPGLDKQMFTEASERVLEHIVQKNRALLQAGVQIGWREALSALTAAKSQLKLQQA